MFNSEPKIYYYSPKKLLHYLYFNLGLVLFSLVLFCINFPFYVLLSELAILGCLLSLSAALYVYIHPLPLATITEDYIQIDRCAPLRWVDVICVKKDNGKYHLCAKDVLTFAVENLDKYPLNFMQKICKNSRFTAFSIPLYAMDNDSAQEIEKQIAKYAKVD